MSGRAVAVASSIASADESGAPKLTRATTPVFSTLSAISTWVVER